jgi:hypothetical protein
MVPIIRLQYTMLPLSLNVHLRQRAALSISILQSQHAPLIQTIQLDFSEDSLCTDLQLEGKTWASCFDWSYIGPATCDPKVG